jgi:hypothetical protein
MHSLSQLARTAVALTCDRAPDGRGATVAKPELTINRGFRSECRFLNHVAAMQQR